MLRLSHTSKHTQQHKHNNTPKPHTSMSATKGQLHMHDRLRHHASKRTNNTRGWWKGDVNSAASVLKCGSVEMWQAPSCSSWRHYPPRIRLRRCHTQTTRLECICCTSFSISGKRTRLHQATSMCQHPLCRRCYYGTDVGQQHCVPP